MQWRIPLFDPDLGQPAVDAVTQVIRSKWLITGIGPRGWLRKISVRHTYSTFEGDLMRFGGKVVEKSADPSDPWILCEIEGQNQEGRQILTGRCTLVLPRRGRGNVDAAEAISS